MAKRMDDTTQLTPYVMPLQADATPTAGDDLVATTSMHIFALGFG
jgi:hypothetical protein